jgi:hypothetical protein
VVFEKIFFSYFYSLHHNVSIYDMYIAAWWSSIVASKNSFFTRDRSIYILRYLGAPFHWAEWSVLLRNAKQCKVLSSFFEVLIMHFLYFWFISVLWLDSNLLLKHNKCVCSA